MYLATFFTQLPAVILSVVLTILFFFAACFRILNTDKFKAVILASPFPVPPTLTLLALLASSIVSSATAFLIILLIDLGAIAFANQMHSVVQVLSTCTCLCLLYFFLIFFSMSIWKWMND